MTDSRKAKRRRVRCKRTDQHCPECCGVGYCPKHPLIVSICWGRREPWEKK